MLLLSTDDDFVVTRSYFLVTERTDVCNRFSGSWRGGNFGFLVTSSVMFFSTDDQLFILRSNRFSANRTLSGSVSNRSRRVLCFLILIAPAVVLFARNNQFVTRLNRLPADRAV